MSNGTLPDGFFENLTKRQKAMLTVLVRDGGWIRGVELRQQMRDAHGLNVSDHPGATNGLIGGFRRRYSKSFRGDLLDIQWTDENKNHAKIRLGDRYRAEVRDRLA